MDIIDKAPLIRVESLKNIIPCKAISVQVAGTNGKGSTCAFLSSVLQAHGKKVGMYISPHVIDICERISVNGQNISIRRFEELVTCLDKQQKGMCKSDLMFFAAVEYFNEQEVDFAVFETGLGGSRDSATLINHKYGIITQIGLDHTEYLGNTIEKITTEKSGIIKQGMNVYAYPNLTNYIIKKVCEHKSAYFMDLSKGEFTFNKGEFSFNAKEFEWKNIRLSMEGDFQGYNCVCALLCTKDMLGSEFSWKAAKEAVERTKVPGRITELKKNPIIIADVSHNPDGIKELCKYVSALKGNKCAVVSIPKTKDYERMMELLRKNFDLIISTKADDVSRNPEELKGDLCIKNPKEAYYEALNKQLDVIVFCGSFAIVRKAFSFVK